MAAVDINSLASGFLRQARLQAVPAATWLNTLHAKAVAALATGDQFVTATGFDGTSTSIERRFDAQQLMLVTELCLRTLEAEEAETAADGTTRIGDFSDRRSTWG
jgi:hypothetical protein